MDEGRIIAAFIGLILGTVSNWFGWRYRAQVTEELRKIRHLLERQQEPPSV